MMTDFDHICPACGNPVIPVEPLQDRVLVTPRDAQVLDLLTMGKSNKAIGQALEIAERTVKAHIRNLSLRLQIKEKHKRLRLAQYWSWPIFRIGTGYVQP